MILKRTYPPSNNAHKSFHQMFLICCLLLMTERNPDSFAFLDRLGYIQGLPHTSISCLKIDKVDIEVLGEIVLWRNRNLEKMYP